MPTEQDIRDARVRKAFDALADAIDGGLTREEYARVALLCVDEATSRNDRRVCGVIWNALNEAGLVEAEEA